MSRKDCPAGKKWDKFLVTCVWPRTQRDHRRITPPPPPPPPPTAAKPTYVTSREGTGPWPTHVPGMWTDPPSGPYLWAAVAVVAAGSILALVLWFLIYRGHRNRRNWIPPPVLQHTDKLEPLAGVHTPLGLGFYPAESVQKDPETSCPHFDGGTGSTDFRHGNDITSCVGGQNPWVTWVGDTGATGRKHRIPLPATELGDTTLVTAKTGRDQYRPV
ncbi:unnamed protein product [Lota lota]